MNNDSYTAQPEAEINEGTLLEETAISLPTDSQTMPEESENAQAYGGLDGNAYAEAAGEDSGMSAVFADEEELSLTGGAVPLNENEDETLPEKVNAAQPLVYAKFNKKRHAYTVTEAAPYVEMGLKWKDFKPEMDKLRYLTEAAGGLTVPEFLDTLVTDLEQKVYQKAVEECGDNQEGCRKAAFDMATLRRRFETLREAGLQAERTEQDAAQQASERSWEEARRTFPEIMGKSEELPAAIGEAMEKQGYSLFEACARYERQQSSRRAAARQVREEAKAASSGNLRSAVLHESSQAQSFMQGFSKGLD